MMFFLLVVFSLINYPVADCHRRSDSDSDEVRRKSNHYSSESDSNERGNRHPIPKGPYFPVWPFPGLWPLAPATPAPPPITPAPTPKPTTTTKVTATTDPRGDNR